MNVSKRVCALIALILAVVLMVPAVAFADTSYPATWAEFTESYEGDVTWNVVADAMDDVIDAGRESFAAGDYDAAYEAINAAYYGYYETTGFERTVMGYISGSRVSAVELQFSAAKSVAKNQGSEADFNAECDKLSQMIHEDANILDGTSGEGEGSGAAGAAATFLACLGIIVREGVEAILVIGAIIAYLVKSGNQKSLKAVYLGGILGVVCSFVAAWLLSLLKLANAAPQEIIEGVTCLIAVVVLYYVSNWMLSKSETKAWNAYIEGQVSSSIETGSSFALVFTAWLSVFREGAEVILFYQPMLAGDNVNMVWAGFGVGCVILVVIFVLMRFFSVRLPLKPFFTVMSALMFVMSISFLGGGIKELIEGNVFTATPMLSGVIPYNDFFDILGVYPIAQTLIPQILLLLVTVAIWVWTKRRTKAEASAAEEASE